MPLPRVPAALALLAIAVSLSPAAAQSTRLADDRPAFGTRNISEAWLIAPTQSYQHFVQGSQYEAGGVQARMADGSVLTLTLPDDHVFEDRQPRLADLDGDGDDEIVLVLSSLTKGASLAVIGETDEQLTITAQTAYIGQPYRWLNPAGISDFDGDGQLDIAVVAMPHLVKRLDVYTLRNGALTRTASGDGFSNHRNGSRHTGLSAVAEFNSDGVADLALPDAGRTAIRFVTLAGGTLREIGRAALPGAADGVFELIPGDALQVGLETGDVVTVQPPGD